MQGLDMAEREPREGTMLGGGSAGASMVPGRMQHRLTHLDLFSGIGGFSLASNQAGFETVGFSEVDPYAIKVLKRHWPDVPNFGDIRTADLSSVGNVTVLTGGFPCQPWSLAGKRRGHDDDRHLWPAMRDAIAKVRPAWVIGENVPGIANMVLADILAELEGLGFQCQSFLIPACAVGAPHIRERVWIVAHSRCGEQSEQRYTEQVFAKWHRAEESANQAGGSGLYAGRRAWASDAGVLRMADGIPDRVDRLQGLGNAIVPQVALPFFDAIAALEFTAEVADARGGSAGERVSGKAESSRRPQAISIQDEPLVSTTGPQ